MKIIEYIKQLFKKDRDDFFNSEIKKLDDDSMKYNNGTEDSYISEHNGL